MRRTRHRRRFPHRSHRRRPSRPLAARAAGSGLWRTKHRRGEFSLRLLTSYDALPRRHRHRLGRGIDRPRRGATSRREQHASGRGSRRRPSIEFPTAEHASTAYESRAYQDALRGARGWSRTRSADRRGGHRGGATGRRSALSATPSRATHHCGAATIGDSVPPARGSRAFPVLAAVPAPSRCDRRTASDPLAARLPRSLPQAPRRRGVPSDERGRTARSAPVPKTVVAATRYRGFRIPPPPLRAQ